MSYFSKQFVYYTLLQLPISKNSYYLTIGPHFASDLYVQNCLSSSQYNPLGQTLLVAAPFAQVIYLLHWHGSAKLPFLSPHSKAGHSFFSLSFLVEFCAAEFLIRTLKIINVKNRPLALRLEILYVSVGYIWYIIKTSTEVHKFTM